MHSDILKRLDIIKNAVALQDESLIAMQVQALQMLPLDAKAKQILILLTSQRFQYVVQVIEQYERENDSVTAGENPQTQGLKLEWKVLKNRVNELTDTRADMERCCNAFQHEYMLRLGSLLEEILKLQAQTSMDAEEQQVYESFHCSYQQELRDLITPLSNDEKQRLKTAYQRASHLCHPARLADECKVQGEAFFKALNDAYCKQNLKRVEEILATLETGKALSATPDNIVDKPVLQQKITALRQHISTLEAEIQSLQEDDGYQRIQAIENLDGYFSELEYKLENELEALRSA
jgi:hypothetical protein